MRHSLENRTQRLEEGLKRAQQLASLALPAIPDPEELEEMEEGERERPEQLLEAVTLASNADQVREEIQELQQLAEQARTVEESGAEAKLSKLKEVLHKQGFFDRYIEKYGTGTLMMIRESLAHALPEPDFAQRGGEFTSTVWRDWLTTEVLAGYKLNERQMKAVGHVKIRGRITNAEYQRVIGCPQRTATRDLNELTQKGIIELEGKGRGAHYRFLRKRARNAPIVPSEDT